MDRKKDIVKCIAGISGKYSPYEVFSDWVKCMALAISNSLDMLHGEIWKKREQAYLDTIRKYDQKEARVFAEMFHMLVETMETNMGDILGEIYMDEGLGNKASGQFFTPYHISYACAKLTIEEQDGCGVYRICEPSCGAGGMIIAVAQVLKDRGINYQHAMRVVAQDLDWKSVYMCYVQLSMLGVNAVVVQGDTLAEPYYGNYPKERALFTPARMGVLL